MVAVIGFGISANAGLVFRSTQKVCNGEEQLFFYSSGKVVVTTTTTRYEGTYDITDGGIAMVINGVNLFARASISNNNSYLDWIIYDNQTYKKCY